MYDQSKLSELTRFARVEAGSVVIDVYPGDGDWTTRRTRRQLRAGRNRPSKERSGRPHADARAETGPRERRGRLGGPRGDARGHATSGCPVAAPVLPRSPHRADPEEGCDGGRLQSSRLRAAEARWVLRHRRPRRHRRGGHEPCLVAASDRSCLRPRGGGGGRLSAGRGKHHAREQG